jgi:hypothetical protein
VRDKSFVYLLSNLILRKRWENTGNVNISYQSYSSAANIEVCFINSMARLTLASPRGWTAGSRTRRKSLSLAEIDELRERSITKVTKEGWWNRWEKSKL